jgi:hypothetical protein
LVQGFVKGAVELPRGLWISCISPTVLSEAVAYHACFTGFIPVPAWEVGQAYLHAMLRPITKRVLKLKTSCTRRTAERGQVNESPLTHPEAGARYVPSPPYPAAFKIGWKGDPCELRPSDIGYYR